MSADSQTLQAKYQKLAAEFAKVNILVTIMFCEGLSLQLSLYLLFAAGKLKYNKLVGYVRKRNIPGEVE